jgi:TRAP-type mannitol/chloroaromatic compound transport system permease large subunit
MDFLVGNFVPLMFAGLVLFLLSGFPVAFSLAATGMGFGALGIALDLFPPVLFQALPLRVFGIMKNDTLLAVPFFTLMGLVLQRSGMAEDLLETVGQAFGRLRGGLAIAVIVVGALLAATTGVISAAVISMGLISLPIMLRYGYNRSIATGVITASGTLAQIIPPSIVLIVMADQLGQPVGDMYTGALLPGMMLVLIYVVFIAVLAVVRPTWVPALPPEALIYREDNGASGHISLAVLLLVAGGAAFAWSRFHEPVLAALQGSPYIAPVDELVVSCLTLAALSALVLAFANRVLRLGLLSRLTEQVVFVLIPPLMLVFLVLGTIFLGIATPTEGGAMGAAGALIMAAARRRLSLVQLRQALDQTVQLTCFVMMIVIGATLFSFTFIAVDGSEWVKHLFDKLPGGQLGFLLAVNLLIFVLGMFIDYFEIAFIVLPIIAPVAEHMGINMVLFGVIIAMNLQTSFLTPPFGYALFFLRSVAPRADYLDRATRRPIRAITTTQIYKGAIVFVVIQLAMLATLVAFPQLVTDRLDKAPVIDMKTLDLDVETGGYGNETDDLMRGFD